MGALNRAISDWLLIASSGRARPFLAIALLDALNPDAVIVTINAGRAQAEQPLDSDYVASLSADAVPARPDRPAAPWPLFPRWPALRQASRACPR